MFGSAVLEVAIGLVFVFLLVSLICSQVSNKISEWLRWRAIELENGIRDLILKDDPSGGQLQRLYANPLIQSFSLAEGTTQRWFQSLPGIDRAGRLGSLPISIPPRTFVLALFDTFVPNSSGATTVSQLYNSVKAMPDSPLKQSLLPLITAKEERIDQARQNVEDWFNGAMDRVSEVYKRNMWRISVLVGLLVSLILNVDAIAITSNLWRDPTLRSAVASAAAEYEKNPSTQPQAMEELNRLELPIGWHVDHLPGFPWLSFRPKDWQATSTEFMPWWSTLIKLLGWTITGLAGAQGAPFWFDLLRKLTQRNA